jgi:predicted RNase H-like HicB family nuclease
MTQYAVVFEKGKRNWSAYVPDLPGCVATGKTRKETEQMIREAIEFHIEGLRLRSMAVPPPISTAANVRVSA